MAATICSLWWFQSAPLTEARGDATSSTVRSSSSMFQSAPLTEARGDSYGFSLQERVFEFQSAPLTEARGDAGRYNQRNNKNFSIRSPHRSKGRRWSL